MQSQQPIRNIIHSSVVKTEITIWWQPILLELSRTINGRKENICFYRSNKIQIWVYIIQQLNINELLLLDAMKKQKWLYSKLILLQQLNKCFSLPTLYLIKYNYQVIGDIRMVYINDINFRWITKYLHSLGNTISFT